MRRRAEALALETLLARLMLAGVAISAICLVLGLAVWLIDPAAAAGARLLTVGLVTLMATPILRTALAVAESLRLKDWFFIATTAAVLVLLVLTLAKAFALAA